jgi:cold-inducible RNA-binding protein
MSNRLFVGNLPYEATEADLRHHFEQVGAVSNVFIPLDRQTGKPRGFAFVELADAAHAASAIEQLHQKPFKDRPLVVNEARPSEARPSGPRPNGPSTGTPMVRPRERTTVVDTSDRPVRRAPAPKRRKGGKRSFWEEGPRKEPIPEKRGGRIFANYEDPEDEGEDVDFENFATGLDKSEEGESPS